MIKEVRGKMRGEKRGIDIVLKPDRPDTISEWEALLEGEGVPRVGDPSTWIVDGDRS
jgi:hypothetical protein